MTAHLQLVQPNNENRSVRTRRRTPARPSNRELRPREYLTPSEVETLIRAARKGRYGHRDATLILVAYRHGLRAVEICDLEWSQVEFDRTATLHVRRAKNGKPAAHPIRGDELRALRELQRQTSGGYVFETERGHLQRMPSIGWSSGSVSAPVLPSRFICTCFGTPAAMPWRTQATTRGQFRIGSGIAPSSTPLAIRN